MEERELLRSVILQLIEASQPFLDGDIVDMTGGTLPLVEKLSDAIESATKALEETKSTKGDD